VGSFTPAEVRTSVPPALAGRDVLTRAAESGRRERIAVSTKLYVGNLAFGTTSDDLRDLFGAHGTVTSASVVTDRETGRSRGFGFVEMSDGADAAIAATNMREFQGRSLTVNEAKPREDRPRSGGYGGGGGGGGGYGGSRRY
jgi:RNA recognition motif-containing protein